MFYPDVNKTKTVILHIKNMVSERCKIIVRIELEKLGLHFILAKMGEVEIMEILSPEQQSLLNDSLNESGLTIIDDKKMILIERIKNCIIELVHYSKKPINTNLSDFLSLKLKYDYTYLANLFSENQNNTIENFFITQKIERAKELLIYDDLNISEIAYKLNYSSVAHLSNQFKKVTGLTPSYYRKFKFKKLELSELR